MVIIGFYEGYFLMKAAFPSSLCIIFEDQFRRREISYFVLVRALRSIYVMLKRRGIISIKNEANFCFILLFGVVSYLYYEKPNIIK